MTADNPLPAWPPRAAADFPRIAGLPDYVLTRVQEEKAALRAAGRDVIDLGIGSPDRPPAPHIVRELGFHLADGTRHGYSASRGIRELREAIVDHYRDRYGVALDPEREVVVTIGAQEGLAHLMLALLGPGDQVLVPSPCYPIHEYAVVFAGGRVGRLPLLSAGDGRVDGDRLLHDIEVLATSAGTTPRALVLSFPSNPTTLVADLDLFRRVVALCDRHRMLLVHDFAYADTGFDGESPPSILQVDGAREISVEFFSMSKSYSMAGWRVGFCVGNAAMVGALTRLKSYLDYGIFEPIQLAAAHALRGDPAVVTRTSAVYAARRRVLVEALREAGWPVTLPRATMFLWAPLPERFVELGSEAFARLLLHEAGVVVSPGAGFGREGEGFVRFALVEDEDRLREAAARIAAVLRG